MKELLFRVFGMAFSHYGGRAAKAAKAVADIKAASASFLRGILTICYDPEQTDEAKLSCALKNAIHTSGYRFTKAHLIARAISVAIILLVPYLVLRDTVGFVFFWFIPKIDSTILLSALFITGLFITGLFITGLFISLHCFVMYGGISPCQIAGARASVNSAPETGATNSPG